MTYATIYKNSEKEIVGFKTQGHAGYAESGSDIVCAAASVLAQNAVNSIEQFTEDTFTVDVNEDLGELYFKIDAGYSHETELLLNSLILGLQGIEEEYMEYIDVIFEEV